MLFSLTFHACQAQIASGVQAGKILHDLKKLLVLKSVLYIGAHPDDENNCLITYLAEKWGFDQPDH